MRITDTRSSYATAGASVAQASELETAAENYRRSQDVDQAIIGALEALQSAKTAIEQAQRSVAQTTGLTTDQLLHGSYFSELGLESRQTIQARINLAAAARSGK